MILTELANKRILALSFFAVIAFSAIASIASLVLSFPYAYAAFGSAAIYMIFAFLTAIKAGLVAAVLIGAAMGVTDAAIGWAISWVIGPGRLPVGTLTLSVWLYTAIFVVGLGAIYGLVGGCIGAAIARWRAA